MVNSLLEHVNKVQAVVLDQPRAEVEDGAVREVDDRLRHGEGSTDGERLSHGTSKNVTKPFHVEIREREVIICLGVTNLNGASV